VRSGRIVQGCSRWCAFGGAQVRVVSGAPFYARARRAGASRLLASKDWFRSRASTCAGSGPQRLPQNGCHGDPQKRDDAIGLMPRLLNEPHAGMRSCAHDHDRKHPSLGTGSPPPVWSPMRAHLTRTVSPRQSEHPQGERAHEPADKSIQPNLIMRYSTPQVCGDSSSAGMISSIVIGRRATRIAVHSLHSVSDFFDKGSKCHSKCL
jgi:hypothetical protein